MSIDEIVEHRSEEGRVSPFSSSTQMDGRMDQNERKKDVTDRPKPIPIREAVGEPQTRPYRRPEVAGSLPTSQAPGLRGQRERPEGPRGKGRSRGGERGRRGQPDRNKAPSGREELQRSQLEPTPLDKLPQRSFEHDGCEWIVRLLGQTSTGSAIDPGAPVMHLSFYSTADPSVACRDALVVGRSLEGLPQDRLPELFAEASSAPPLTK